MFFSQSPEKNEGDLPLAAILGELKNSLLSEWNEDTRTLRDYFSLTNKWVRNVALADVYFRGARVVAKLSWYFEVLMMLRCVPKLVFPIIPANTVLLLRSSQKDTITCVHLSAHHSC